MLAWLCCWENSMVLVGFHFLQSCLWYMFRNQNLVGQRHQSDIHKCTKKKKKILFRSFLIMNVCPHTLKELYWWYKYKISYQQIEQVNYLKHSCDALVNGNENDFDVHKIKVFIWSLRKWWREPRMENASLEGMDLHPKQREQQWWDGQWRVERPEAGLVWVKARQCRTLLAYDKSLEFIL